MNSSAQPESPDAARYLDLADGRRLAYHKTEAAPENSHLPTVVFLGGYSSDMTGAKAMHLDTWANASGRAFLRFDYTGHGQSSGAFEDGTVGAWAQDAQDAITALSNGPLILVGSSMGGWISLLMIKRMPERVAAFVGIAAAPDFTEDEMWRWMTDAQKAELEANGKVELPSDDGDPYTVTTKFIEDGRRNLVLRDPIRFDGPVRLLHGTKDEAIDMAVGLKLLDHLDARDARLTLIKDGDHRLSEPRELALLAATIDAL